MSVAYKAAGTTVGNLNAVSPVWPEHQAGDIGILIIETGGEGTTLNPAGWTHVTGSPVVDVASIAGSKLHVLWKRAASSSEAAVTTGDSGDHQLARIFVFSGVRGTGDPISAVAFATKATASTTATIPAITTTEANQMLAMIATRPDDATSTTHFGTAVNANLTNINDRGESGNTAGHGGGFVFTTATKASIGSTGTTTHTKTSSTTDTTAIIAFKTENPPTLALGTADGASFTDTTPAIAMTGTDPDGDDLDYGIQIATANTFIESGAHTSNAFANADDNEVLYTAGSYTGAGEAFIATRSATLTSVEFMLRKIGSPTGAVTVKLYAATGTPGSSGNPGTLLYTSTTTQDASALATSYTQYTYALNYAVTAGTGYVVTIEFGAGDNVNYVDVCTDATSNYTNGNLTRLFNGTWDAAATAADDMVFVITDNATPNVLHNATSDANGSFIDITDSADRAPFTSGHQVAFTLNSTPPASSTVTTTQFASTVTSMPVNLPSSIVAGQLLIAFVEMRNAGTWTVPTGWVEFGAREGGGAVGELTAFYKITDGTEGVTATWTASTGSTATWQVRKIVGWHGTTPPEIATAFGDATTANPASLTPSWGSGKTLWLVAAGHAAASATAFTAGPANYTDFTNTGASSGGAAVSLASAYRELEAASDDPGTFTVSSNRWWATLTIAIRALPDRPLDLGTYYWRAKVKDPGGTNTYTAWSATRSFIIAAPSGSTGQIKTPSVAKPVKVLAGGTWTTKPLKRWNGSAWVATNY